MRKLILIALLFGSAWQMVGQIVNIEDRRYKADSVGWMGQFDLGGAYTKYKSKVTRLNAAARVERFGRQNDWLVLVNYTLVKSANSDVLNDGFIHLRFNQLIRDGLRWEAFVQTQYNELLSLRLRQLVGTGPRIRLAGQPNFTAYAGILYMYEYDEFVNTDNEFRDHRVSSYLSLSFRPTNTLTFASTTYYQPLINDWASSRLSTTNTLTLTITERLSFNARFSLTYDSLLAREVGNVPNATFAWTNGLRLSI